jgi:UDP-N-acetylglucosamine 3-dehydrogenase
MGRHHVKKYAASPLCELVGLSDPDPDRAQLAAENGTEHYIDHRELLDQKLDLVTIAAPTTLHYRLGCDALDAGCNLLIEKPITDELETARKLQAMAAEAGKLIAVGHIERFNPAVIELRRLIEEGELGELLTINNLRVGPYHGRILDTGIVLDLGTHDVDLISYLFGTRAFSVFATAMTRKHNLEDHAVLQLAFPDGHTGIIETSWLAPYRARSIFVVGTKHFALCDLMNKIILIYEDNPEGGNLLSGLRPVPAGDALEIQLESVMRSVLDGTPPVSDAADSIYALEACTAALQSIASGKSVSIGS